jgi:hypothetical protein
MTSSTAPKRVLFIGQQPETVDFSDPALPPGFDAAKIHAGIAIGMQQMAARGWAAELCLVPPDASATEMVTKQLVSKVYDCVVIGGGIRTEEPAALRAVGERRAPGRARCSPCLQHDAAGHGRCGGANA